MLIVTPDTVTNPTLLEMRQVPRRFLGRGILWPRRGGSARLVARTIFEVEILRYLGALLPFVAAALIWQQYALAIAQAPLIMIIVVYFVEMKLLRVPPPRRAGLIDAGDAERGLDLLQVRAQAILTKIAAGRGLGEGRLHLVVEQSDLARLAPLTYVSVQTEPVSDRPEVLRLTDAERALIFGTLFQPPLDERRLHLIGLARDEGLHDLVLEAQAVSAHARLAALLART